MHLDVVIPTYNRHDILKLALESLLRARVPPGLSVGVIVADNNSKDATRDTVEAMRPRFGDRLHYLLERKQGRSHALNAGIMASTGELVGFIDDDEEVDGEWYNVIFAAFQDPQLDFIGGPYLPKWEVQRPDWVPTRYPGVLGIIDGGPKPVPYDANYPGILMGGNAVFRRRVFDQVGLYAGDLGRCGNKLMAEEDNEMYQRLLNAVMRGTYLPSLAIHHRIPRERVTKSYFRRWFFWRGVSLSITDQHQPQKVARLLGLPRYIVREGIVSLGGIVRSESRPERFTSELPIWTLLGFAYGRYLYRADSQ